MRRLRRCDMPAAAVVALAVMVMVASACGGPGGDPRPPGPTAPASAPVDRDALIRALGATRAVERGRVQVVTALTDLDDEPDPPPGGRLTVARYRVAFDRRAGRVDVEADLSPAASALGAPDLATGGDVSAAARMIAVGDTVYARGGPMAAAVGRAPGGWVAIDRGALIDGRPISDAASLLLDPLGPFEVVGDATGDPRVVGHDVIRGSPVTHVATSTGSGAAAVHVWIDADGVIRRLEILLAGSAGAAEADAGRVVTTIELFDLGRAVPITPPDDER